MKIIEDTKTFVKNNKKTAIFSAGILVGGMVASLAAQKAAGGLAIVSASEFLNVETEARTLVINLANGRTVAMDLIDIPHQ